MRKAFAKLTAVLLAVCLMAGGSAAVFASGFEGYDPMDHKELTAGDLQYKGWDDDTFDALLEQLQNMDKTVPDSEFLAVYQQILDDLDECYDQYVLADAAYYADVNSTRAAEASDEMYDALTDAQDDFYVAMQNILHGPNGTLLRSQLQDSWIDWIETYVEETDELEELYKEENRLVQEYYSAVAEAADIDDYDEAMEKENELCGPIFLDLLQVRDEIAEWNGYDNYYEYAFDSYGRDYDPEDIKEFCKIAKYYFVPLYYEIYDAWWGLDYPESVEDFYDEEEILDKIEPFIGRIHPDLTEAFAYLRRNKTYDLEWSDKKAATGYTDNLPGFRSAFIFNSPYDTYQDYSDIVHEFGHFNAAYHDPTPSVYMASVLDVAEIHSQALELLITHYADELYGIDAPFMTIDVLFRMLNSILSGCMYDEFQREVYEDPYMTLEEINDLAERLSYEYGMDGSGCEAYEWVDVSHNFDMPCYYVSYATSALSALDIWRQSLEDWDGAVDRYMQVTALPSDMGYLEAVEACGLMDFRNSSAIGDLSDDIYDYFDENYAEYAEGGEHALGEDPFWQADNPLSAFKDKADKAKGVATSVLKGLLIIAVIATLLVVVVILILWKKHKGEEITNQTPPNPGYTEDPTGISSYYQEMKPNTQSVSPEAVQAEPDPEESVAEEQ